MDYLIAILTIVFCPTLTLLGTYIIEKNKLKTKQLDVQDNQINKCQEKHMNDVTNLRKEFNSRLDTIEAEIKKMNEIQLKSTFQITSLRAEVQKHNSVIERTYKLEGRMDALEGKKK